MDAFAKTQGNKTQDFSKTQRKLSQVTGDFLKMFSKTQGTDFFFSLHMSGRNLFLEVKNIETPQNVLD